jgi:outer membrane protein assembly factor BamB
MPLRSRAILAVTAATVVAVLVIVNGGADNNGRNDTVSAGQQNGGDDTDASSATGPDRSPAVATTAAPTTTRPPFTGWSDPFLVGKPYGDKVDGLLTFRGNLTRTYYGKGPVPSAPAVQWRFPASGGMCSASVDQSGEQIWCGMGWTGQPAVFERGGRTWVVFGAYDRAVHFLDATTGQRLLPDFPTGDIIKGSVTIDADGFPLVYSGSRDNYLRILAIDRDQPVELFKLSAFAVKPTLWNDDWDGSPLIIGDYLLEGGENSQFHVLKLNRAYGADGKVTVDPQLVFNAPGWDPELLRSIGDNNVSIEGSVAVYGNTAYFSNSGGLVQGWDLTPLRNGGVPQRVFRYWAGDDTDATIVIDEEGMLYVGVEYERLTERSRAVGQIIKLDPTRADPLVWKRDERPYNNAGVWATPALYRDIVIHATDEGKVIGLDRATGELRWSFMLPRPTWQSPVVVDDVLIMGDCAGVLHGYDVRDTRAQPKELWSVELGGCIESTPAVWKGRIFVGTRAGGIYAIG